MHGVIVQVRIDSSREEEARSTLHDVVVPRARALAGFSSGTWLRALDGDGVGACCSSNPRRPPGPRSRRSGPRGRRQASP